MNVPLVMLATPVGIAFLVYLLRRWLWAQAILSAVTTLLLGVLTLQVPLDQVAVFAGRDMQFSASWVVLGRSFTFLPDDRPALAFVFFASALFFAIGGAGKLSRSYHPVGLVIISLLAATIFVQPFLFAALFLEMIAAFSVIILADDHHNRTRGALRLLVFVTLGVPFILLAGWQLEGVATSPDDPTLLVRATLLLNIGFLILLAIAPFHSWMPSVAEEASPLSSAFVFTVVQAAVMFFMLKFFTQYDWLRTNSTEFAALRLGGAALVLAGGVFAFAQRRFGRLMGYAVMTDLGAVVLAIGLASAEGLQVAMAIVALRALSLAVWGLGLGWLREDSSTARDDDFESLVGRAWRRPFAAVATLLGGLSLLGFPLTAGFTGRWALYRLLATADPTMAIILLLASASAALAYARGLAALIRQPETHVGVVIGEEPVEGSTAAIFLGVGVLGIVLLGFFPQWILPAITRAAESFIAR